MANEDPNNKWYAEYYYTWKEARTAQNKYIKNNRKCKDPEKHDEFGKKKWKIEYQREQPTEPKIGVPKEYRQ